MRGSQEKGMKSCSAIPVVSAEAIKGTGAKILEFSDTSIAELSERSSFLMSELKGIKNRISNQLENNPELLIEDIANICASGKDFQVIQVGSLLKTLPMSDIEKIAVLLSKSRNVKAINALFSK